MDKCTATCLVVPHEHTVQAMNGLNFAEATVSHLMLIQELLSVLLMKVRQSGGVFVPGGVNLGVGITCFGSKVDG